MSGKEGFKLLISASFSFVQFRLVSFNFVQFRSFSRFVHERNCQNSDVTEIDANYEIQNGMILDENTCFVNTLFHYRSFYLSVYLSVCLFICL